MAKTSKKRKISKNKSIPTWLIVVVVVVVAGIGAIVIAQSFAYGKRPVNVNNYDIYTDQKFTCFANQGTKYANLSWISAVGSHNTGAVCYEGADVDFFETEPGLRLFFFSAKL